MNRRAGRGSLNTAGAEPPVGDRSVPLSPPKVGKAVKVLTWRGQEDSTRIAPVSARHPLAKRGAGVIRFNCPRCGHAINAGDDVARKRGECPACGQAVVVPGDPAEYAWPPESLNVRVASNPQNPGPTNESSVAAAVPILAHTAVKSPSAPSNVGLYTAWAAWSLVWCSRACSFASRLGYQSSRA